METQAPQIPERRRGTFQFSLRELLIALALLCTAFGLTPFWHEFALNARAPDADVPETLPYYMTIGAGVYRTYTPLLASFFFVAAIGFIYSISRRDNKKSLSIGLTLAVPLLLLPYPLVPSTVLVSALVTVIAIIWTLGLGLIKQRLWCAICGTYNLLWLIVLWAWLIDLYFTFGD